MDWRRIELMLSIDCIFLGAGRNWRCIKGLKKHHMRDKKRKELEM
jgi:hypothetical protein